ncbi:MAG: hypothetical protein ACRDHM_11625 [Actinomycetota bacterium]
MDARLLALVAAVLGLSACAGPRSVLPEDVLFVRAGDGITLVRGLPGGEAVSIPGAVPSTDWSTIVRATPQGDGTRIVATDSPSGSQLWSRDVLGKLEVRVASQNGALVALGKPREVSGYAIGRAITTLVILGASAEPRTIELDGNYQPEAFSTDGQSLFVVEYLPAERPTRYRVRRLDLLTEEVVGVYTVDQKLQKAMQGTARIQAGSRDGRRLYTLYTLEGTGGPPRAFVHVLSLDRLWAHCIDLPMEFAHSRESSMAISVSPDGRHVYVADTRSGMVASLDTESLSVADTASVHLGSFRGVTQAAAGPQERLFLGKGTALRSLDTSSLSVSGTWQMPHRITGLQPANDGRRLYVGQRGEILVVDTQTGEILPAVDVNVDGNIDQLGGSTRFLSDQRTELECAC